MIVPVWHFHREGASGSASAVESASQSIFIGGGGSATASASRGSSYLVFGQDSGQEWHLEAPGPGAGVRFGMTKRPQSQSLAVVGNSWRELDGRGSLLGVLSILGVTSDLRILGVFLFPRYGVRPSLSPSEEESLLSSLVQPWTEAPGLNLLSSFSSITSRRLYTLCWWDGVSGLEKVRSRKLSTLSLLRGMSLSAGGPDVSVF